MSFRRFCHLTVLICLLILILGDVIRSQDVAQETISHDQENSNIGDQICGPKCVRYLLDYYEKPEDVVSLIREMQWPDIRHGTSLKDLADALEKRGIFTSALQVSPYSRIVHSEPVIVHLKPKSEGELGHFVVWLPSSSGRTVRYWNTDGKISEVNERKWRENGVDAVLLTSPKPIDRPRKCVKWAGFPFYGMEWNIIAICVFVFGLYFLLSTFSWRRIQPVKSGEAL